MSKTRGMSLHDRISFWLETILMTKVVAKDGVGPVMRWLFRLPLFFQRVGLGMFIPRNVLILTTVGRRSGKPHTTPVEFSPGPVPDSYLVMSGWDGHTDWYRNMRANPCVHVWLRGRAWEARGERVPDAEVARLLKNLAQLEPRANRMWSRWAGVEMDGSDAGYLAAASHFPSFYLLPEQGGEGHV